MNLGRNAGTEITEIIDGIVLLVVQNEVEDESARELRRFDPVQCRCQFALLDDDHRGDGAIHHSPIQLVPRPSPQEHGVVTEANKANPSLDISHRYVPCSVMVTSEECVCSTPKYFVVVSADNSTGVFAFVFML